MTSQLITFRLLLVEDTDQITFFVQEVNLFEVSKYLKWVTTNDSVIYSEPSTIIV